MVGFQQDFISMELDVSQQRSVFRFKPDTYLCPNASLTIYLPEKASYTLGSDVGKLVQLGPFSKDMADNELPRLSNVIQFERQALPCSIRNLPSVLHLACSLTCGKGTDMFLSRTPFSDHHIMYTFMFDESAVKNRAIVVTECEGRFSKVKRAHHLLEKFSVAILDDNFQLLSFSARTYTRCAFRIRPAGTN